MPRTAIVIGVGGTGAWVLSWLKKDLLETYSSLEDQPVRMLLLDIAPIINEVGVAGTDSNTAQRDNERRSYSRFVIIDEKNEFIQLPTAKDPSLTLEIRDAVLREDSGSMHLAHWFRAGYFPRQSLMLSDGAGQFRQLGRLALVQGLHLDGENDPVFAHLRNLVSQLSPGGSSPIDVHIAGSFAGGTGSGVFLDIAWLVRQAIPQNIQVFVSGFFALPSVFTQNPSNEMRAKAFNAWRELNRMQTIQEKSNEFLLRWGQGPSKVRQINMPAYDHVYLVDPGRELRNQKASDSIFPIMAEAISFFIDSQSGHEYIQHIRANLAKRKTAYPYNRRPTFSTLYVKSWKLPLYHNLNVARHELAMVYLERLLNIREEMGEDEVGNPRRMYRLEPIPGCGARSVEMFTQTLEKAGNTQFITLQGRIKEINLNSQTRSQQIRTFALAADQLVHFYAEMPENLEGQQVAVEIQQVANFQVPFLERTNNTEQINYDIGRVHQQLYGMGGVGGDYATVFGDFAGESYQGQLFEKLEHAHKFHLRVFRTRVRRWMERELNSETQKASGLACVLAAVRQLRVDLENSIRFFIDIRKELPPVIDARNRAANLFRQAFEESSSGGLIKTAKNMLGGGAKGAMDDWLQVERAFLNTQRGHRAIQRSLSTLEAMHDFIADEVLPSLERMENQLVTDNRYDRIQGLYRGLAESLHDEEIRHQFDLRLSDVTEILQDETSIPEIDLREVDRLISRTSWEVDENMNVIIKIQVSDDSPPIELQAKANDQRQTLELVNAIVRGVANRIVATHSPPTALEIKGVDALVSQLRDNLRTLYTPHPTQAPLTQVRTLYVRTAGTTGQHNDLIAAMNRTPGLMQQEPSVTTVVGSDNPNKIVVFSANELLLPENFNEWDLCQQEYRRRVIGDSRLGIKPNPEQVTVDHLFAAEQNALALENRFYTSRLARDFPDIYPLGFPNMGHRLVHLLEYRDRLLDFFELWATGNVFYITREQDQGENRSVWVVQNPRNTQQQFQLCIRETNDMIGVIERFVIYGRPLGDSTREIPYRHLHEDLVEVRAKSWLNDETNRAALVRLYEEEIEAAEKLAKLIYRKMDRSVEELRAALQDYESQLTEDSSTRSKLAEELAADMVASLGGYPLVSDRHTHFDAINIITRIFYMDLADQIRRSASTPTSNGNQGSRFDR